MRLLNIIYHLIRWTLAGVFIYSGATKMIAPQSFAVLIEAYGLVPQGLLMPVALILPAMEVLAGIGLLADIRGSLAAIGGLLLFFMAILGFGIHMGLDVDCGCFGADDPEAEAFHGLRSALYRDMAMLTGVVLSYGWRRYRGIKPRGVSPEAGRILADSPRRDGLAN